MFGVHFHLMWCLKMTRMLTARVFMWSELVYGWVFVPLLSVVSVYLRVNVVLTTCSHMRPIWINSAICSSNNNNTSTGMHERFLTGRAHMRSNMHTGSRLRLLVEASNTANKPKFTSNKINMIFGSYILKTTTLFIAVGRSKWMVGSSY